ncbi:hypothetical protein GCM10010885_12080 [Alicyclobacillus cellulosilyticus]|uniref:Uncharacterized protein n=1 Tax=Alicyclobacillus cellulosilyticus TaxID=1003997 RepID=A0A917K8V2_9BACL|nr:hypothetical protein GCM10010885_12080 [Alicyclobacillus cellulosilyticus]
MHLRLIVCRRLPGGYPVFCGMLKMGSADEAGDGGRRGGTTVPRVAEGVSRGGRVAEIGGGQS